MLAEMMTYRVLSPRTFDTVKAGIVSAAVVISPLMAVLGVSRLSALKHGR